MKSAGARVPRQRGQEMSELYASLRWPLTYHHVEQILDVEVDPMGDRVDKHRVRGRTRTLTTRLKLDPGSADLALRSL